MMKEFVILSAVCLAFLFISGCDRHKEIQASGKTIKLGIIGPFSGENRTKGLDGINGLKTAMTLSPLIQNGDEIDLLIEDDKNEPLQTLNALNRLVTEEQVSAIILMSTSSSALEIRSRANELQIPVLAMLATHPDVTKDTGFISQLCFDNIIQASVAALFVMDELLLDRTAVFTNPASENSTTLATGFINKYQSVGGDVTDTILVKEGVDYSNILEELRDKGTELLYLPLQAKHLIPILKVTNTMNWQPEVMGSDGLVATVINNYKEDADLLEGLYAIDFFSQNEALTEENSWLQKISKTYKARYREQGTSYVALGFESYMIMQNAMNRCQNPGNRLCINRQLRNTKNFTGLASKISINEKGKASRPLIVNTIKNGKMEFIVKVY